MPLTDEYANIQYSGDSGTTNNTTPVTVVSDPGAGNPNVVVDRECFGVLNEDTANATIIITLAGTVVERVILSTGDRWTNPARMVIQPGETLTITLAGTISTNQLTWNVSTFTIIA